MNKRFCPKCGISEEETDFIKAFCQKCYLEDHEIISLPEKIKIEFCKRCNRVRFKGKMLEQTEELIKEIVLSKIKIKELLDEKISIELLALEEHKTKAVLNISGKIDAKKISLEKETILIPVNICCEDCSRIASGYYEGTLQVRCPKEKIQKYIEFCEKFLEKESKQDMLAVIVKLEKEKNGFNARICSRQAAFKLARELRVKFKGKMSSSSTVVGRKLGKELKRVTFNVKVE